MTHFVLCSGKARHGKDTSAAIIKYNLEERGKSVLITHYADLLKFICTNFFGWNGEKDEAGRTLLQSIGTDCIRAQNQDYWVDFVTGLVKMFPGKWDYVIVPDVRFPNEIERVHDAGFAATHIHIVRPEFDSLLTEAQKHHPSETALDNTAPDYIVRNTTMQDLKRQLFSFCDELITKE